VKHRNFLKNVCRWTPEYPSVHIKGLNTE